MWMRAFTTDDVHDRVVPIPDVPNSIVFLGEEGGAIRLSTAELADLLRDVAHCGHNPMDCTAALVRPDWPGWQLQLYGKGMPCR